MTPEQASRDRVAQVAWERAAQALLHQGGVSPNSTLNCFWKENGDTDVYEDTDVFVGAYSRQHFLRVVWRSDAYLGYVIRGEDYDAATDLNAWDVDFDSVLEIIARKRTSPPSPYSVGEYTQTRVYVIGSGKI